MSIGQTWQDWIGHSGRKFLIYSGPHVADPCLLSPVIEFLEDGTYVEYSDLTELRNLVNQIQEYIDEISRNSVSEEELSKRVQEGKKFGYVPNYPQPLEGNENKIY